VRNDDGKGTAFIGDFAGNLHAIGGRDDDIVFSERGVAEGRGGGGIVVAVGGVDAS